MSVLFDCRYVRVGTHDGISRFSAGVVGELGKLRPVTMLIHDTRQLEQLPDLPWVLGPSPTSPLEPFIARRINRLGFETVYSPMQTMGSRGRNYRLALTVHDLIYYRHPTPPRDLPWYVRLAWRLYHRAWWPQRLLLNGADLVVTVSNTTKQLVQTHRLTRRPVVIVHNAADSLPGLIDGNRTPPTPPKFVYMGSFMPYKNVDALVLAMNELPGAELHLLSRISGAEKERLTALAPVARLVFHNGVSDAEYAQHLDTATALVSASLDEGFGIPLIEAGARGTPVVVSDIAIFREIAGESGIYFNPHNPTDIAQQLRKLEDDAEWRRRSMQSRVNADRFSWAHAAGELSAALDELDE
ncbi:MAG: glycosyltransferase family 4 protein [Agromyces sp.]